MPDHSLIGQRQSEFFAQILDDLPAALIPAPVALGKRRQRPSSQKLQEKLGAVEQLRIRECAQRLPLSSHDKLHQRFGVLNGNRQ